MNWLASPEWAGIVKALLHTLWQGGIIAGLTALLLKGTRSPVARYRCLLTALMCVMMAGLVTWAVLNQPISQRIPATIALQNKAVVMTQAGTGQQAVAANFTQPNAPETEMPWTAWLAMVWLFGATLMIGRAGMQVAGAERLRRSSRPLEDGRVNELLAEVRRAIGVSRRIQIAATDKLTSPAVVGVLVPTLLLPLSLTTAFTPEQIRFVLLHELAHIRRGDYVANLFQMFAEALLFFNPAVWWISRQLRIEREACCDLLAIELSGSPGEYARTLVQVAENGLQPILPTAMAFSNPRDPSSLTERVQRLLVPGYRPRLRLTWRAMLGAFLAGSGLLFISAIGTRVTLAAILTPEQRIERIGKRMTELGERPVAGDDEIDSTNRPKVKISGRVRAADGTPVPKWIYLNVNSSLRKSSTGTSVVVKDAAFSDSVTAGIIHIGAQVKDFAPAVIGPLDGLVTNQFENLEVVLERGFDVPLQLVDAETAKPLRDAVVAIMFWMNNNGFQGQSLKSASDGSITLTHCADLPLDVTVNVPGYEIVRKRVEHLHANEPLRMELRRGEILAGMVVDKTTGQPIAGAEFHLLNQAGSENSGRHEWSDPFYFLGKSDGGGQFDLQQLRTKNRYYIGVTAPRHETIMLEGISAGKTDLLVRMGPELVVHGHVVGSLEGLQKVDSDYTLSLAMTERYENNSYVSSERVRLHVTNGIASFEFTNRFAGVVKLIAGGNETFERQVDAPVADWVINLAEPQTVEAAKVTPREVILKFKHPSGVAPKGTVYVIVPSQMNLADPGYTRKEMDIVNGEVRARSFVGSMFNYEPAHTVGYWFKENVIQAISKGPGPLVIEVPVIPAGAIYARARNEDGTRAGGLLFGVNELKKAPGRDDSSPLGSGSDSVSGDDPRQWVSGPLPLGGTYQVHGWRGNAFCVSKPVRLTEANPDAEVELQMPAVTVFEGVVMDVSGKPVRDAELKPLFVLLKNHSFGLKPVFTDEHGRFRLENMTPGLGEYTVELNAPGLLAENVKLDFNSQPQRIQLKPGRTLGGRVVQAGTGYVIPGTEVRVVDVDHYKLPALTTKTDADGRFVFTSLGDVNYGFYTGDGQLSSDKKHRADGSTNVVLAIKLYEWSKVKPKQGKP